VPEQAPGIRASGASYHTRHRRRAAGIPFFQFALHYYGAERIGKDRLRPPPGSVSLWDEYEKWKHANPEAHARAVSGGLIGSPETIRNKLRKFETSHVDQIILLNQAGKNTHEHICESLEFLPRKSCQNSKAMSQNNRHGNNRSCTGRSHWKKSIPNRSENVTVRIPCNSSSWHFPPPSGRQ
jgi:hypothetical protein